MVAKFSGRPTRLKAPVSVPVPPVVVTETSTVVPPVPAGTTAVNLPECDTLNDTAATPPNATALTPRKFNPRISTVAPTRATTSFGETLIRLGRCAVKGSVGAAPVTAPATAPP